MATIANLAVSLTARIGNFEKGFKKAQKVAKRFSMDMARHVKQIASYGSVLSGAVLAAVVASVRATSLYSRELRFLSDTANASTEELQRMAYATNTVGIGQEKLGDILKDVNDRVGDFIATGGGPMADFFENIGPKVGLTIESFRKLSGPQALQAYYNALEKANLNQQDMTFYLEAIASDSTRLIPLLRDNGKEMGRLGEEAESFNYILSNTDVTVMESLQLALDKVGASITAISRRIAIQLAPFIEVIANRFRQFAQQSNISGEVVINVINSMLKGFGKVADIFELLKAGWNYFVAGVSASTYLLLQPTKLFMNALNSVLKLFNIEAVDEFDRFYTEMTDNFATAAEDAVDAANKALGKFARGENANRVGAYFQGIVAEAAEATNAVEQLSLARVEDQGMGAVASTTKTSEFKQVDLSRIAIGGASSKDKPVSREQGASMVDSLERIARNTQSMAVVT